MKGDKTMLNLKLIKEDKEAYEKLCEMFRDYLNKDRKKEEICKGLYADLTAFYGRSSDYARVREAIYEYAYFHLSPWLILDEIKDTNNTILVDIVNFDSWLEIKEYKDIVTFFCIIDPIVITKRYN